MYYIKNENGSIEPMKIIKIEDVKSSRGKEFLITINSHPYGLFRTELSAALHVKRVRDFLALNSFGQNDMVFDPWDVYQDSSTAERQRQRCLHEIY